MMDENIISEVRACIGDRAFLALIRKLGGKKIYVPKTMGPHHPIAEVLGEELTRKLISEFAGAHLNLPASARKQACILADLQKGEPLLRIAEKYWVTDRYVRYLRAQAAKRAIKETQLGLF